MKLLWTIVIIAVVIAGGWYVWQSGVQSAPDGQGEQKQELSDIPDEGSRPEAVVVNYRDGGFTPASVTVPQGVPVRFVNESSGDMWVASSVHPTHSVYSGTTLSDHCPNTDNTAFDQCETGDSYEFSFTKTGQWNYHNHVAPNNFGSIIVE